MDFYKVESSACQHQHGRMTLFFAVIRRELGNSKKHSADQLGQSASMELESKKSQTQAVRVSGSTPAERSVQGSANCMQHQGLPYVQPASYFDKHIDISTGLYESSFGAKSEPA